jgi:hypothetical protein
MYIKTLFLFVLTTGLLCSSTYSQEGDFCDAVSTILRDAPNKFRNIKGKEVNANMNAIIWECGIKVPGTIGSRFVVSMGAFYEGAFYQTRNLEEIKAYYDRYRDMLSACLKPQGYVLTSTENFYPGLGAYKKLVFMKEVKEDIMPANAPPHVKNYTVVMYLFEH